MNGLLDCWMSEWMKMARGSVSIHPTIHSSIPATRASESKNPLIRPGWLKPLDPPRVNHRMKRHDRRAFLRFDGHAVEIPVVTRFAQSHVDRLHDFVARLGLAARAHDELVTAPITLSERDIFEFRFLCNRPLRVRRAINPKNIHRRPALKFIQPLAKRAPILVFNFFHK